MDVKNLNNGLRTAACALALIAVAAVTYAQRPHSTGADAPGWTLAAKDQVLDKMNTLILTQAYVPGVDFTKWPAALKQVKAEAEKAPTEAEFAGILDKAMRDTFKISHIVLLPPEAVKSRVDHQMIGIGIRINIIPEGVFVVSTVPGAPAQKAGIEAGDIIMEADGHHVDGPTYIAGPKGTSVNLKVKKNDGTTVKMYKVVREPFDTAQREELIWLDKDHKDTAVIKIYTFDLSYSTHNVEELMKEASTAKNLIVDLRNNGGGAVGYMLHFLSTLLPPGTQVGTFINKKTVDDYVDTTKGDRNDLKAIADFSQSKLSITFNPVPIFKGHVAVLVNPGSGSASEITAEALKELDNAPVVGRKSAGAVLVSVMGDLPHGFNLQYPISDYISAKGVRLEANGIVPDETVADVPFLKPGQIDPAYTAAETLLNKIAKSGG